MIRCEIREPRLDVVAGLANHLEVADNGILRHRVCQKTDLIDVVRVELNALDGSRNVPQVVAKTLFVRSYGNSVRNDRRPKLVWKCAWGDYIDRHTQ
jgi:hypothetical protein